VVAQTAKFRYNSTICRQAHPHGVASCHRHNFTACPGVISHFTSSQTILFGITNILAHAKSITRNCNNSRTLVAISLRGEAMLSPHIAEPRYRTSKDKRVDWPLHAADLIADKQKFTRLSSHAESYSFRGIYVVDDIFHMARRSIACTRIFQPMSRATDEQQRLPSQPGITRRRRRKGKGTMHQREVVMSLAVNGVLRGSDSPTALHACSSPLPRRRTRRGICVEACKSGTKNLEMLVRHSAIDDIM
jgi:hypothetical protein